MSGSRGRPLALAESCTGGMIELLGVSPETLERCGAVSEETVLKGLLGLANDST